MSIKVGIKVGLGLLLGQEQAGGLHHVLSLQLAPGDVGGGALGKDGNGLADLFNGNSNKI